MEGEFVMVIYFMYSVSDHKSCIWNMILYSIPKVKEPLAAFPPPLFFSSWIPFQVCLSSQMRSILENIESSGEDVRLNLQALITHFRDLSPHTTVKILYKWWRKGIDAPQSQADEHFQISPNSTSACALSEQIRHWRVALTTMLAEMAGHIWGPGFPLSPWQLQGTVSMY